MPSHCIVIDKKIAVTRCPIPKNECFFQHRQTHTCMYGEYKGTETLQELSNLVGIHPTPCQEEFTDILNKLKTTLVSKD